MTQNLLLSFNIQSIVGIISAILVLLIMVTVHEFGHYVAGKKLGFKINEFAVGFGPAIFRKKMKSGEFFSLRAVPLGGYCAFVGEDEENESEFAFNNQKPWKRIIVLVAGAFMNFLTTLVIVVLAFTFSGQYLIQAHEILPNAEGESVSSQFIMQEGDIILSINGKTMMLTTDISTALEKARENPTEKIDMTVIRNGEKVEIQTFLRNYTHNYVDENGVEQSSESYGLGFLMGSTSVRFNLFESIGRSFSYCFKMAGQIFAFLGDLLSGAIGLDQVSGPIGTISMTAEIASYGFRQLLEIMALIGVNLAVFNLLPIPALDGSRVVFTIIEWIRKKPLNRNLEATIHFIGMIALFAFAIIVDVAKLF